MGIRNCQFQTVATRYETWRIKNDSRLAGEVLLLCRFDATVCSYKRCREFVATLVDGSVS